MKKLPICRIQILSILYEYLLQLTKIKSMIDQKLTTYSLHNGFIEMNQKYAINGKENYHQ